MRLFGLKQTLAESPPGDIFDSCGKCEAVTLFVKMIVNLKVRMPSASLPHRLYGTNCYICYQYCG